MIKARDIVRWLCGSLMTGSLLLLAGCTEEGSDAPQKKDTCLLRLSSVTRTGETRLSEGSVKLFVTTANALYSAGGFSYTTVGENTGVSVKEDTQHYLYGFMPNLALTSNVSATADDLNDDYSKGADLTLTGLPVFSSDDICVIVGVRRIRNITDTETANVMATEGNYGYLSGISSENYVNLLVDHLYSQLTLQFNVDKDYYALRRIKLKSVSLTSTYGEMVNAKVMIRSGYGLRDAYVIYEKNTGGGDSDVHPLFSSSTDDEILLPSDATGTAAATLGDNVVVNCAPCTFDAEGTHLSITCTYDVYDVKDNTIYNKVRENCTATNKVRLSGMGHGVKRTVTVTVAPTYLYVLSDNDLNNPTIKTK